MLQMLDQRNVPIRNVVVTAYGIAVTNWEKLANEGKNEENTNIRYFSEYTYCNVWMQRK